MLRHAWLNLWDKHMTTGRINQVCTAELELETNKVKSQQAAYQLLQHHAEQYTNIRRPFVSANHFFLSDPQIVGLQPSKAIVMLWLILAPMQLWWSFHFIEPACKGTGATIIKMWHARTHAACKVALSDMCFPTIQNRLKHTTSTIDAVTSVQDSPQSQNAAVLLSV
jgi:hypothetical protein